MSFVWKNWIVLEELVYFEKLDMVLFGRIGFVWKNWFCLEELFLLEGLVWLEIIGFVWKN